MEEIEELIRNHVLRCVAYAKHLPEQDRKNYIDNSRKELEDIINKLAQ